MGSNRKSILSPPTSSTSSPSYSFPSCFLEERKQQNEIESQDDANELLLELERNTFEYALKSNEAWANYKGHQNPAFFEKLASGQSPSIRTLPLLLLMIQCIHCMQSALDDLSTNSRRATLRNLG